MAIQSVGNFGKGTPLPAAPQGSAPQQPAAQPEAPLQAASPQQTPSKEQLQQIVKDMKELVPPVVANNLQFSMDDSTGKVIVRITDAQTGEMIRQIPSEELLEIARSLDRMQGLLLRQTA
jgi:flagellar protein FlaG